MSNIEEIKVFLNRIKRIFKNATLRLEVKEYSDTYIVDIAPIDVYKNPKYISLEEKFSDSFESKNPYATIVFVSEHSLLRADENNLKIEIL